MDKAIRQIAIFDRSQIFFFFFFFFKNTEKILKAELCKEGKLRCQSPGASLRRGLQALSGGWDKKPSEECEPSIFSNFLLVARLLFGASTMMTESDGRSAMPAIRFQLDV